MPERMLVRNSDTGEMVEMCLETGTLMPIGSPPVSRASSRRPSMAASAAGDDDDDDDDEPEPPAEEQASPERPSFMSKMAGLGKQRFGRRAAEATGAARTTKDVARFGRADLPSTRRGDAAGATRLVRGDECDADIPWRRVAATPRVRRGYSAETSRGDAAGATRLVRGDERDAASPRRRVGRDADITRRRVAAAATQTFRGDEDAAVATRTFRGDEDAAAATQTVRGDEDAAAEAAAETSRAGTRRPRSAST